MNHAERDDFLTEEATVEIPVETMSEVVVTPRTATWRERPRDTLERAIVTYLDDRHLAVQAEDGRYLDRGDFSHDLASAVLEFPDEVTAPVADETIAHLRSLSRVLP